MVSNALLGGLNVHIQARNPRLVVFGGMGFYDKIPKPSFHTASTPCRHL